MDIGKSHAVLSKAAFGDASEFHDRTRPTLDADGRVHMDPEDGHIVATANVRTLMQSVSAIENTGDWRDAAQALGRPETYFMLHDFSLVVTEARLIWEQNKLESPGEKMAGHLRFPWISTIEFRPKQSFLNEALLRLEFTQDFPVAEQGVWFHTVELGFERSFHPGSLAHGLAKQIALHHLRHGCPDDAREAMEALSTAPPVADPPKGKTAVYDIPAHAHYPGGIGYIGDGVAAGEWHVHT